MKRLGKINRKPVVEGNPNKLKPTDTTLKEVCGCDGIEDNLSKVEKAYILDYTKNYNEYVYTIDDLNSFYSCVVVSDMNPGTNYYRSVTKGGRINSVIGFTVFILNNENDTFFSNCKTIHDRSTY